MKSAWALALACTLLLAGECCSLSGNVGWEEVGVLGGRGGASLTVLSLPLAEGMKAAGRDVGLPGPEGASVASIPAL